MSDICKQNEIHFHPLFQEGDLFLVDYGNELYLIDQDAYLITSHPYEPCLCISQDDEVIVTIHNAFDTKEIYELAEKGGTIRMISGQEYDLQSIGDLLSYALKLKEDSMDISYLEGRRFIRILMEQDAFSPSSSIDLTEYGLKNHHTMDRFVHAHKIKRTADDRYYVIESYPV